MDDIQLCKDIMSLKQELRQIVSVPGTVHSHYIIHMLFFVFLNLQLRIDGVTFKTVSANWVFGRKLLLSAALISPARITVIYRKCRDTKLYRVDRKSQGSVMRKR